MYVALRGVATLKARALKEVWNVAAAVPVPVSVPIERGVSLGNGNNSSSNNSGSYCEELVPEENFLAACNQEMLARGGELLKRTRKGIIKTHNNNNKLIHPSKLIIMF